MAETGLQIQELIRRALDARQAEIHVCLPGFVKSYDPATKTCSVELGVKHAATGEDGETILEEYPILQNIPVGFVKTASFQMHFNLAAGDSVVVHFFERTSAECRKTGKLSDPGDLRLHALSSCLAMPHWTPDTGVSSETDESMGKPGGPQLRFGASAVSVGTGADFVAMMAKVDARLSSIQSTLDTGGPLHTHTSAAPGSPTSPAIGWPVIGALAPTGSSNLKADG